jgi:catechol 2,3-dioxygenase-like lactoylglutathione lyase family enzyme
MKAHLRVARPTNDLDAVTEFYRDGLGFEVIGGFGGNGTIDGVMLGHPALDYHLEFTYHHGHNAGGEPSDEHLLVFYLPDEERWTEAVSRLQTMGHDRVRSSNPYWEERGATFEDPDGYRIVFENAAWTPS